MAPRVSETDVLDVVKPTELVESDITPFLTPSHRVVEDMVADESVNEVTLEAIELYIAAHLSMTIDPRVSGGSEDSTQITFEGETGMKLKSSRYGQIALVIDPTGNLERGYQTYTISAGGGT